MCASMTLIVSMKSGEYQLVGLLLGVYRIVHTIRPEIWPDSSYYRVKSGPAGSQNFGSGTSLTVIILSLGSPLGVQKPSFLCCFKVT